MRTSAGMSSPLVAPTSGWMSRPSTISSAHFWMYSCARWIGLRVWNPTTVFQPRSANAARVWAGVRRYCWKSTMSGQPDDLELAGDAAIARLVERPHPGVIEVLGAEDGERLLGRSRLKIPRPQDRERMAALSRISVTASAPPSRFNLVVR